MAIANQSPIRLIMFTSDECIYCPPIKSITFETVGAGMESFVHVSVIDVKDDVEAAKRYNITALPTLMINEQIVLQGGMDDDAVREILWNTLLSHAIKNKELIEMSKKSLLTLTMNYWESLNMNKTLRKKMGDFIHLSAYQLTLLSLYSLDPLVPYLLYNTGKQLGVTGLIYHILNALEPRLGKTSRRGLRFKFLAEALELYFSDKELLPTYFAESARLRKITSTSIELDIYGLASATMGINVGEPMCDFTAGQLAGVTTTIMGHNARCTEIACAANGADKCTFKIELISQDAVDCELPKFEDVDVRFERRNNFYEVIHELTLKLENSLLMRNKLRPLVGDYLHISALQPIVVSLKLIDEFSGSILFSAGRELGIFGPGKDLLYSLVQTHNHQPPLDLNDAAELVYKYLSHPASNLSREYGLVTISPRNPNNPNKRLITIEDYAAIAGINNTGKTFCDFMAGFIAGRATVLIGHDPWVKEIECQGTGAKACTFEITLKD